MKKLLSMLAMLALAVACSESEPLAETDPVPELDKEIISGTNVDPFGAKEGTLDDAPDQQLTAYVYATRLDASGAYVSYAPKNVAAEGYMVFESAMLQVDGKYPIAPVGFSIEDPAATGGGTGDVQLVDNPQYYPGQEQLYMAAIVPANKTRWVFDSDYKVLSCAIDGRTDVMVGIATTMNDGVSPIQKKYASDTVYPTFNFKHKGTLVRVKVYAPQAKDLESYGKITRIEAVATSGVPAGVHNTVNITLEDGTCTPSGAADSITTPFYYYGPIGSNTDMVYTGLKLSSADDLKADSTQFYGPIAIPAPATDEDSDFTGTDAKYVGYSIIAPFEAIAGTNISLILYAEKAPRGVPVPITTLYTDNTYATPYTGSTEGKRFDVTLKITGQEIIANSYITDWQDIYFDTEIIL